MQSIKACLMDDFSGEGLKGIALNTDRFNEDLYKKPEYGAKIRVTKKRRPFLIH